MKKIEISNNDTYRFSENENQVTGLAYFENKIYVARANSVKIQAISSEEPFDPVRAEDINVLKLFDNANNNYDDNGNGDKNNGLNCISVRILDVVACDSCSSLFICRKQYSTNTVWKIKFPNKTVSKILENESEKLYEKLALTLSTNSVGELLVLVNQNGRWYVHVYRSSDCHKLQSIIFQETNIEPRHAVRTPLGNIFMSYSVGTVNAMFVGEVSSKGGIVRKFGFDSLESSPTKGWIRTPNKTPDGYLAFDGSNGIFVADASNDRIFRLDPRSMECQTMMHPFSSKDKRYDQHQLDSPTRLCYSFEKQCLMVGQNKHRVMTGPSTTSVSVSMFDLGHRVGDCQPAKRSRTTINDVIK